MRKNFLLIVMGLITIGLISCSNSKEPQSYAPDIPGEDVGLILVWVIDGNEATRGTAPFALYDDNGNYYVDFNGEACRVRKISPINVGDAVLYYSFSTNLGDTYYLEDISDPNNRLYNQ